MMLLFNAKNINKIMARNERNMRKKLPRNIIKYCKRKILSEGIISFEKTTIMSYMIPVGYESDFINKQELLEEIKAIVEKYFNSRGFFTNCRIHTSSARDTLMHIEIHIGDKGE